MSACPLHGLRILVTRPAHQAAHLCELIQVLGGEPVLLPALAIAPPRDPAGMRTLVAGLDRFDFAIFVSANAAERGMALIRECGGLPPHLKIAAVGERTARALVQDSGHVPITAPPPYNSEALLSHPAFQALAGRRVMIFRGEGGRERLAEALRQRGATVAYAEVYRRIAPEIDLGTTVDRAGEIEVVVATSQDALRNLAAMADTAQRREWLISRHLAVISERVAQLAAELGFIHPPLVAKQASDQGLVETIAAWRRSL